MVASGTASRSVWLVRHAESTWNADGLVQGHSDIPVLTELGRRDARRVGLWLAQHPVTAVLSSDLRRARQTAAAIGVALGLTVRTDPRLRERCFGALEGTASSGLRPEMSGIVSGRVVDVDARAPGGESLRDLSWRLGEFAGWLGQLPELGDGTGDTRAAGDVVIVAHGGSIRALAAHLGGSALDRRLWDPVPNCSIRRFPLALVAPGAPLALLGSGPGNQGGS